LTSIFKNNQNTFVTLDRLLKGNEHAYLMVVDHNQMPKSDNPEYMNMFFRYGVLAPQVQLTAGIDSKNKRMKTVGITMSDNYYSAKEGIFGDWEQREGNIIIPSNRLIVESEFKSGDKIARLPPYTTEFYFGDSAINYNLALFRMRNQTRK
jgi:hypothetical protein